MSSPKPPLKLLRQAAELRAGGSSWETVAQAVQRTVETVRRWPRLYPAPWQQALQQAEQQILNETTAESVLTLRRQLRSEDDKASRDAAEKLLRYRLASTKPGSKAQRTRTQPPTPSTDAARIVHFLEGLNDAQLAELLQHAPSAATPPTGGLDAKPHS